jgi:hypothetical protein
MMRRCFFVRLVWLFLCWFPAETGEIAAQRITYRALHGKEIKMNIVGAFSWPYLILELYVVGVIVLFVYVVVDLATKLSEFKKKGVQR